jgi:hypothetical protein
LGAHDFKEKNTMWRALSIKTGLTGLLALIILTSVLISHAPADTTYDVTFSWNASGALQAGNLEFIITLDPSTSASAIPVTFPFISPYFPSGAAGFGYYNTPYPANLFVTGPFISGITRLTFYLFQPFDPATVPYGTIYLGDPGYGGPESAIIDPKVSVVPLPSSVILLGSGLIQLARWRRRNRLGK